MPNRLPVSYPRSRTPPPPASVRYLKRGYCLRREPVLVLLTVGPAADGCTVRYLSNTTSHPPHWSIPNTSSSYTPDTLVSLSIFSRRFCLSCLASLFSSRAQPDPLFFSWHPVTI